MAQAVEGALVTRETCACEFFNAELGQGCATPTAGGSGGSVEFSPGAQADNTIITVALVGGAGIAALFLLGVI